MFTLEKYRPSVNIVLYSDDEGVFEFSIDRG